MRVPYYCDETQVVLFEFSSERVLFLDIIGKSRVGTLHVLAPALDLFAR